MKPCIYVSPKQTLELLSKNAILIDIRETDEHLKESIPGAKCKPLSLLSKDSFHNYTKNQSIIFHCQSGNRTRQSESLFESFNFKNTYILDGGINAWKKNNLNTTINKNKHCH